MQTTKVITDYCWIQTRKGPVIEAKTSRSNIQNGDLFGHGEAAKRKRTYHEGTQHGPTPPDRVRQATEDEIAQ